MKIPQSDRTRGFTLVELLVVIAIIAVLAAAGFSAGNFAIQKAKKVTALASCTAIESAVNDFFTEYGSMPTDVSTEGEEDAPALDTVNDKDFLRVLLGIETSDSPLNTRSIKFLSVREGKSDKNGLIYTDDNSDVEGLYDPWGGPYYVKLDTGYDDKVKDVQPAAAASSVTLNGRRVAVWTNGADNTGLSGSTGSGKTSDDVKTW